MILENPLSQDKGDGFLGNGKVLACFPLGNHLYRVIANMGRQEIEIKPTAEEMQELVHNRSKGFFKVKTIVWLSPFWIHSEIASRMSQGNVFITGDAAHVHSPAGGQGMNTGIQDAYNLAWKLALVIKGQAYPFLLLKSYQDERYPIIKSIIRVTERLTKMGSVSNSILLNIRDSLIHNMIGRSQFLKSKLSSVITQLAIRYKQSPIIDYQTNVKKEAPQPGERAPDLSIANSSQRLYDYFRHPYHNLLLFTGSYIQEEDISQLKMLIEKVQQNYSNTIACFLISPKEIHPNLCPLILDSDFSISKLYGCAEKHGMCLIRPDLYIAQIMNHFDEKKLVALLDRYIRSNTSLH